MKIGIDARLIEETGVGRYIRNLIRELGQQDLSNTYVLYISPKSVGTIDIPNARWQVHSTTVRWHTLMEQFVMPILFLQDQLDLVHIPYFNVPISTSVPFVVTVHDLIVYHFDTGKASTLPYVLYKLRRIGYKIALAIGLARARSVIAVSESTKKEIIEHFSIAPKKITVTYEGVDPHLRKPAKNGRTNISSPYLLYVGNAYPHKNLEFLVRAFDRFLSTSEKKQNLRLVLVGTDRYFYPRLKQIVGILSHADQIDFYGQADDRQLQVLYEGAAGLVFPSKMEGFGLPALEALSFGRPLLVSDIPVFHEILRELPIYFTLDDIDSFIKGLDEVLKSRSSVDINRAQTLLSSYSWSAMAGQTLKIYNEQVRKA